MSFKPENRINPVNGIVPEHRHDVRNWHWAWSTHDGKDPQHDPRHVKAGKGGFNIYRPDPLTPAQKKARVGYTATNAAILKDRAAKAAAKAAKPKAARKTAKAAAIRESVELVADLASASLPEA